MNELEQRVLDAAVHPKNVGEMADADAVGSVGSEDCGDMLRMWIKFKEDNGRKVIDKATFQTFGCQTALAVASMATELIRGKTSAEALELRGEDLSAPLGPLPPMKIHCAQLVEDALKNALREESTEDANIVAPAPAHSPTLLEQLHPSSQPAKIVFKKS